MKYISPYILDKIGRREDRRKRELLERLRPLPLPAPQPMPRPQPQKSEETPEESGYIIFDIGG